MIEDIIDIKCCNKLKGLTPVLKKWTQLVVKYSEHWPADPCYWYNERANIGVLAAAAWQYDHWISIEEYSTKKIRKIPSNRRDGANFSGRCDLFLASKNGRSQFACEAKQAVQSISNEQIKDEFRLINIAAAAVWEDVSGLNSAEATHRVALTICVPRISIARSKAALNRDLVTEEVCRWLVCAKGIPAAEHGYAFVFPRRTRMLQDEGGKYIFPGVGILIRERLRSQ